MVRPSMVCLSWRTRSRTEGSEKTTKPKTTRETSGFLAHDNGLGDLTLLVEVLSQGFFAGVPCYVFGFLCKRRRLGLGLGTMEERREVWVREEKREKGELKNNVY